MAKILFYTSIKTRVRDQESLLAEFIRQGHVVFFVNQQPNSYLPKICKDNGAVYLTIDKGKVKSTILRSLLHILALVKFVWRHNIDVVFSHLEPANFIAVFAQYFIRARVVIVRHHHNLGQLAGFAKDFSYKITYKLARSIIVVSETTKKFAIENEGISANKIHAINLGYDFSTFGSVDVEKARNLAKKLNGYLVLITVGRLDDYKRPSLSIELTKRLLEKNIMAYLFLLGDGERLEDLKTKVKVLGIQENVEFLGYSDDVLTYLKVSDWLIHPSISESSCVVVKEAGLVELPVIACDGVGDFTEYLTDKVNSCLVNPDNFVDEAVSAIINYSAEPQRKQLGQKLNNDVINRFHISQVIKQYNFLVTH
ncbi:MAG: glycosyltransferase [Cytophagia bacterium]|nr:glycosyltransferase [Cytophagia bacterium]